MAAELVTVLLVREKLKSLKNGERIIDARLDRQVKKFHNLLESIEKFLEDEAKSASCLNPDVLQIIHHTEDTIDTFLIRTKMQKHNVFPYSTQLKSVVVQTRFLNKMEKILNNLSNKSGIDQLKSTDGSSVRHSLLDPKTYSHHSKTDILDVEGRTKKLAELILNKHSRFHIFVVDVPVSAKKTMLSKIFFRKDIKEHFKCRAWATISDDFQKEELLIEVWKQVTGNELPVGSVKQELHKVLDKNRYLVVLIDVPTPDIWEILKHVFPNACNGSRVIFSFQEADAGRNPDIRFFGREFLPKSEEINQASSAKSEDLGEDTSNPEQERGLAGAFDYLNKETEIVGLKDKALELAHQLTVSRTHRFLLISVVGVAGSGKTTLVKTIYNDPYIRQKYEFRAWVHVYVSHDFDMRNILIDILKQAEEVKNEEELVQDKLETKLTEILSKKSFLIVLDDVHLPSTWYELESFLSSRGSETRNKVILIIRETSVARCFKSSVIVELNPLKEEDGWKLFLKKVKRDENKRDHMYTLIRKQIWEKCQGLPLAICLLGGLLYSKSLSYSEWPKEIEKIMPGEKEKDSTELISSLDPLDPSYIWTLGYKDLSPRLRACLHYLCLFPKSYEIPVRRLCHLWIAERFVVPSDTGEERAPEEDVVKRDFEQLVRRNMIEVTRWRSDETAKTCRVPSTLYEVFCPNAENMGFFHIHRKSDSTPNSPRLSMIRRLVEHFDLQNKPPPDECIQHLRSYISFNTRKGDDKLANEVGNFLNKTITKKGFGLLRVLDLEGMYKPVLPVTLGKLPLLSYVGLRWTFLDSIPESVGDLPCLETLDLKHTNITTLPVSILKVKTLRHLYMNEIYFQMPAKTSFASVTLTKLQTLWGLLIGNTKITPTDWLVKLSGIRKLGLTCHKTSLEKIINWICSDLNILQSLRLRSINDFSEPSDLNLCDLGDHLNLTELYLLGKLSREIVNVQLPPNLKILTLSMSRLLDDPMPMLGELKHLNILRLFGQSYIGERMSCLKGGFPKLRVLKLWLLKDLEEWTIEGEAMSELRELEIRYCQKLMTLDGLEKVVNLRVLTLTNMGNDFAAKIRKKMGENIVIYKKDLEVDRP